MEKTSYYIFALAFLFVYCRMPFLIMSSTSLATDQSALLALKSHITLDPHSKLVRNWTNSSSICHWVGVACNSRRHRVAALDLSSMGLVGTIPQQLGNLSFLVSLNLSHNNFHGTLPQQLSHLRRLKYIDLYVNNFSGEIPSGFGVLHKLQYLRLSNNTFTGLIPCPISNLSNLEVLAFSSNSLRGKIPEELGRLTNLQKLSVQLNRLTGSIPLAIFNIPTLKILAFTSNNLDGNLPVDICRNLPSLEGIYLSHNRLSGPIPSSISKCSQLQILSLSINSFSGQIPKEIGKLEFLQILYLGANNLSGSIPREIGNLTMLTKLGLDRNNLTGLLPHEIGKLYQLEGLYVHFNNLNGSVPLELFNVSTLQDLEISYNFLSGSLPMNLCHRLPFILTLRLNVNHFTGPIPDSISNCSQLRDLSLGTNKFTGVIPYSLGDLRFLERLYLYGNNLRIESSSTDLSFITSLTKCRFLTNLGISDNPLGGVIPASIGNLSRSLQYLYAQNCEIRGTIPEEIGNLSNFLLLDLSKNELMGSVPVKFNHFHKIQGLFLEGNKIKGTFPEGLCHLQSLNVLNLSQNHFSGLIPECLGNLTALRHVFLDSNMFISSIPSSMWQLRDLIELNLSTNSLGGFLPPEIGRLATANLIDLSMNQLSGDIPSAIGNLQALTNLSLAHNRLEGPIPETVGSMINLATVDLSCNKLSGPIPKSLETLRYLEYLNVSFNALSGEIPSTGRFRNFTFESFKGNEALCGISRFHVISCSVDSKHRSRMKKVLQGLLILTAVVSLIIGVFCLKFVLKILRRKERPESGIGEFRPTAPERISYYEILQATGHFSEGNLLGTGSFGSVYKGVFRNGKLLAVKVFDSQLGRGFKSFAIECDLLRNLRHKNLTKVISSCSNEEFKALILEYMPNGSLEKWLYSNNYSLNIMERLNTMIDVGSALEYLHHGYFTPIVHCDLTPSNVLFGEEMVAHVSDFGIAKLLGEGESIVHTNTLATLGYMAPEYGSEGLVSTRCDVYSFGIMLMETFTRKRPSDDMFSEDFTLKKWIGGSLSNLSNQIIDADLMNPEEDHFEKKLQCVIAVMELALKCSAERPRDRLNMKNALVELHSIKRQLNFI